MEGDDQQVHWWMRCGRYSTGMWCFLAIWRQEGWYPPVQVMDSISRLMPAVAQPEHKEHAALLRRLMAVYARSEDLVRIGAYKPGSDLDLDRALRAREAMHAFMTQDSRPSGSALPIACVGWRHWQRRYEAMPVSRSLRRLLHIRNLEEEQGRLVLESALSDLRRLENALEKTVVRARSGRRLVGTSAHSGELEDRQAGIEETRAAGRHAEALKPRIADAELDVATLRAGISGSQNRTPPGLRH